jgi:CMP-N-acetylneuraminic acid synthetase
VNDRVLALVTARGGSKSIPGKNIAPLAGKPLLAWTIEAARGAAQVDRIVLSTDDPAIARAGREHGAEVPFLRPAPLAGDDSPHIPVVLHALAWLAEHEGYRPEWVVLLQPTSPLRESRDIDGALAVAMDTDADAVVAVSPLERAHLIREVGEDGRIAPPAGDPRRYVRRQDARETYAVNGAVYLVRTRTLIERQSFYGDRTYAYHMPRERSVDIDTVLDMKLAELLLRERERP